MRLRRAPPRYAATSWGAFQLRRDLAFERLARVLRSNSVAELKLTEPFGQFKLLAPFLTRVREAVDPARFQFRLRRGGAASNVKFGLCCNGSGSGSGRSHRPTSTPCRRRVRPLATAANLIGRICFCAAHISLGSIRDVVFGCRPVPDGRDDLRRHNSRAAQRRDAPGDGTGSSGLPAPARGSPCRSTPSGQRGVLTAVMWIVPRAASPSSVLGERRGHRRSSRRSFNDRTALNDRTVRSTLSRPSRWAS
ncbi:hypothetical protein JOD31_001474 [Methylopila capsulata]|uniref:Uncharacterized protein n=1 Tax=Methylopila capsulata TaxID=61654 RepID=A0ABS2T4Z9_9HYPH|nr:hypothetical protein [Methylopila capsulata]